MLRLSGIIVITVPTNDVPLRTTLPYKNTAYTTLHTPKIRSGRITQGIKGKAEDATCVISILVQNIIENTVSLNQHIVWL